MTVEALWADICRNFAVWKGVGHFERKFRGKGASPTNDFWHQKSRVPGLSYGEKKIAEKFNRLSRVHQRPRQTTDRQTDRRQTTDGIAIAYSKRNVIRWRLLKMNVIWNNASRKIVQCCWRESVSCLLYYSKVLPMLYYWSTEITVFEDNPHMW